MLAIRIRPCCEVNRS